MRIILILLALILETLSVYIAVFDIFLDNYPAWWRDVAYAVSHGMAAILFTYFCMITLPERYRTPKLKAKIFIFGASFTMPVVGILGLSILFYTVLKWPKKPDERIWRFAEPPVLPIEPSLEAPNQFGTAGLKNILLYHHNLERRLEVVVACRHLNERNAIPLLKIAVKDREDDVRLLAYAIIERIEDTLNKKIDQLKAILELNETVDLLLKIGDLYWELYYLEISDGTLSTSYLNIAQKYYEKALEKQQDPETHFKLGRVYVASAQYDKAKDSFEVVLDSGNYIIKIAFYLAEIAFHSGDYSSIRPLLNVVPTNPSLTNLHEIKGHWYHDS